MKIYSNIDNNWLIMILSIIIPLIFMTNVSSAVLDCSKCHMADIGKSITANDTIEITNNTCLKCHNSDYPPTPIGYNTHLAHVGKYSVKADYLTRHPKVAESLSCNSCHVNIGNNCRNCHRKNIPHIQGDIGKNCKGCHGEIDKLFLHPTINLKIHNIFNVGSDNKTACTMCHNPDDMRTLRLANGLTVSIQEPHRLCYQCHSGYYRLWDAGSHYSNKTIPRDIAKVAGLKADWENYWRIENTCTNCHNPHSPNELYQLPRLQEVKEMTGTSNVILGSTFIYIISAVISIIIILVTLKYRDRLKRFISKISKISIPKISIPKISIPVSISVEKYDETGKTIEKRNIENITKAEKIKDANVDTKEIKKEKELIKPIEIEEKTIEIEEKTIEIEEKPSKMGEIKDKKPTGLLRKYKGDILFISGIGIMFLAFYAIFGIFIPIAVVISESMSPHMEKGDIIFFTDISRIDKINTYNENGGYESFEDYGNVILYKPSGKEIVPIIHRAMYYVEKGEPMWKGGPSAPYAGYITKGDNIATNSRYDQEISTSYQKPVKKEWIIGIARFRIPYVGYIRLILPI